MKTSKKKLFVKAAFILAAVMMIALQVGICVSAMDTDIAAEWYRYEVPEHSAMVMATSTSYTSFDWSSSHHGDHQAWMDRDGHTVFNSGFASPGGTLLSLIPAQAYTSWTSGASTVFQFNFSYSVGYGRSYAGPVGNSPYTQYDLYSVWVVVNNSTGKVTTAYPANNPR